MARLYHECGVAADEKFWGKIGPQFSALHPILDNLCHSIELALKSYLKKNGLSFSDRDTHSIKKLFTRCRQTAAEKNEAFPLIDRDFLDVLTDFNVNKVTRYGERPEKLRRPLFTHTDQLAQDLLEKIDAPTVSEMGGAQ